MHPADFQFFRFQAITFLLPKSGMRQMAAGQHIPAVSCQAAAFPAAHALPRA
jgi:hypothetical protein